jgi:hypothetical protein
LPPSATAATTISRVARKLISAMRSALSRRKRRDCLTIVTIRWFMAHATHAAPAAVRPIEAEFAAGRENGAQRRPAFLLGSRALWRWMNG